MAKRVLLVHGDAETRSEYRNVLWYNGFDVEIAASGPDALASARARAPDLALLGLIGPGTTALDLCRALAPIPVLVVAARAELDVARAARLAGCACYLEEPVPPVEVLFAVERLIGRASLAEADEPDGTPPRAAGGPGPGDPGPGVPRPGDPGPGVPGPGDAGPGDAEPPQPQLQAVVEPPSAEPPLRVEVGGEAGRPSVDAAARTGPLAPPGEPPPKASPANPAEGPPVP